MAWRRDGRELFYFSNDGRLMSVDVAPGATFQAGAPRVLFQVPIFGGGATTGNRFSIAFLDFVAASILAPVRACIRARTIDGLVPVVNRVLGLVLRLVLLVLGLFLLLFFVLGLLFILREGDERDA
jgi:hypothetical protein